MERRAPAKGASQKRRRKKLDNAKYTAISLSLLACILALMALGVRLGYQHRRFLQMKSVVENQSFFDGTTVEGIDVSDMTLADALTYWREQVEPKYADRAVTLDDGERVTAWDLGYSSDYESVLTAAWSAGRSGSLEERFRKASERTAQPTAYAINRTLYSEDAIDQFVFSASVQINQPAKDAGVESFDASTLKFVFSPAEPGSRLDTTALKRSIMQALDTGGGAVNLVVEAVPPGISDEEVSATYGLIAEAKTNASSSSRARLSNIKLAMSLIHGTCVKPGEVFSFNATVGERTAARGFQMATAYSGGEVTEQVGGGICQVSTTLFNAAVKSDMQILERHNHSLTVGYVDRGKDATVNWKSQDFKFRNTSDENVYVCCYLTSDKRVRFGLFGKRLPNGETITVETRTVEKLKHEVSYQPTQLLLPGEKYIAKEGKDGYVAEAYKVRWDAGGNRIGSEFLCKSTYKRVDGVVLYGVG